MEFLKGVSVPEKVMGLEMIDQGYIRGPAYHPGPTWQYVSMSGRNLNEKFHPTFRPAVGLSRLFNAAGVPRGLAASAGRLRADARERAPSFQ